MAWARLLIEIAIFNDDKSDDVVINFQKIAEKFLKYYWDQMIHFDLIQGSRPSNPPLILTEIKKLISIHYEGKRTKLPIFFERIKMYLEESPRFEQVIKK